MVSFQCEGCGDVVKKPKLDKHGMMCNSAFTCIDCSKVFNSPAEWKSHTQCISEAEKYQKGLYKGPKGQQNGGPRNNFNGRPNNGRDAPATGKYQSWGRNNGPQGARPAWGRQYVRSHATGANDTPLGTPVRMSPVSSLPESPAEPEKKLSPVAATPATAVKSDDATPKPAQAVPDKKQKKDKKRKNESVEGEQVADSNEPPKKRTKAEGPADDSQAIEAPKTSKDKKHKNKHNHGDASAAEVRPQKEEEAVTNGSAPEGKKRRKEKRTERKEQVESEEAVEPVKQDTNEAEDGKPSKKSKKAKGDGKGVAADAINIEAIPAEPEQAEKKHKKEHKEKEHKKHKKSKSEVKNP